LLPGCVHATHVLDNRIQVAANPHPAHVVWLLEVTQGDLTKALTTR